MIHNWRCFDATSFSLPNNSFVISDDNGVGKTSLLAAVYSLYTSNPWVGTRFSETIKQNTNYFGLLTAYPDWSLSGQVSPSGRLVTKYSKPKENPMSIGGDYPAIFTYTPLDNMLLSLPRTQKLAHFDQLIGQIYPEYLKTIKELDKCVKSKFAYIKHCFELQIPGEDAMVIPVSESIYQLSLRIWELRKSFFDYIHTELPQFENWIKSPLVGWNLKHSISHIDGRVYPLGIVGAQILDREQIMQLWSKERAAGKVLYGAHRDDIVFISDHVTSETSLSRGEMRLLVLFLKSLSMKMVRSLNPNKTIFWLLDDVFNEFDITREKTVYDEILSKSEQYIITSTQTLSFNADKYTLSQLVRNAD